MDARKVILLIGALFVAAVTAFMARSMMVGTSAPIAGAAPIVAAQPADTTEVLVAKRSLPIGTILDPGAVEFRPWPKELVQGAYFIRSQSDPAKLQGTVVRYAIPAGQPVTQGALVKPGDRGFLAAALGPGMRAVTVPVSAQSAVAGFVFPGDHVDLILTQSVVGGGDGQPLKASETVLRNLRVLATDQQTDDKGNTVVNTYSTVTVEATPKIAEKVAVAQTVGTLSLSLRSIADTPGDLEQAIASGAVDVPADSDPKQESAMIARVKAGPIDGDGDSSFATGADVSRFQRRTVPGKSSEGAQAPTPGMPMGAPAGGAPGIVRGPVVRVVRGSDTSLIPIGGKN